MYWKCRYRGGDHMAHQSKTPLKLHQSGSDFHRKLSSYQTLILYWLDLLRKPIKNLNFPGFGARLSPPQIRKYQVYPNTTNLKLCFNFAYVLTIIEYILGHLEHYISENKLFPPYSAVKMVKNTCKLHQTSTKCWSIMLKFGQNIRWHILNLTEPVLKLHLI